MAQAFSYPDLPVDQMLAIAVYGEQVAAYRYTVLAERVPGKRDRRMFAEIAQEEQSHRERIQRLLNRFHPDSSFYLSEEDKALVVAGPRLVDVRDPENYRQVVQLALDTEYRVACFYQAMVGKVANTQVRKVFKELADESFDHHARLSALVRQRGFLASTADET